MIKYEPLPYDFDLNFDIKTKDQLVSKILTLQGELDELNNLVEVYNLDISDELVCEELSRLEKCFRYSNEYDLPMDETEFLRMKELQKIVKSI